jgi:hypothetical protein
MLALVAPSQIELAVARLDAWLETMRGPGGYGGPVAHWWQQSLIYTGPGLDWRYEGIIAGYLRLWERSSEERWLERACRAGDDLVAGQLANGNYLASAFEHNPASAGTPHEAACDAGLLLLALALRSEGRSGWEPYAEVAQANLRQFYIGKLWDAETRSLGDSPRLATFVPNKAATACEALFLMAELSGEAAWVEAYAMPTLERLLGYQVADRSPLEGAIAQGSLGSRRSEKYFPIYIARCVPALLRAYSWGGDGRFLDAALRAMAFIARRGLPDGRLPTVVYGNGTQAIYPLWVAPLGDVLRAADQLKPYGFDADLAATRARLLAGQDESGGFHTAEGFGAQAGGQPGQLPDIRDVLHVVGWCDKAFRYLAGHAAAMPGDAATASYETACTFRGHTARLVETPDLVEVISCGRARYRWRKGERWPDVAEPEYWLR